MFSSITYKTIIKLLTTCSILLLLDVFYITNVKEIFSKQIINVQRVIMNVRMEGVIICYILLTLGLYYFILRSRRSEIDAFILGVFVYGVYDSTNYATLKRWEKRFALMDTLWGGILFAITTFIYYKIHV